MAAQIDELSSTLGIAPESQQQFHELVALIAWQCGQPQQLVAPAPFDCTVAAPQVTLDDAVMQHHLAQMMTQGAGDELEPPAPKHARLMPLARQAALEQIKQCLAGYDAGVWHDYAATYGIAVDSSFNDWPDAIKGAALRAICLRGADLTALNVDGIDLRGIDLQMGTVDPSGQERFLSWSTLPRANFDRANLVGVQVENGTLQEARFNDATLKDFSLSRVDASDTQFVAARLSNVHLHGEFQRADFSRVQGNDIQIRGNFTGANFSDAHLTDVDFSLSETPDFTDASFDQTDITLSENYLQGFQRSSLWGFLLTSLPYMTLLKTLSSIDDRWVQTKVGLMRQLLEVISRHDTCDAFMSSDTEVVQSLFNTLHTPFYAKHAPFVTEFINRHLLPAIATMPELIQALLPQRAEALLSHWNELVTHASWKALVPAQLALQRVLHVSAGLPGNVELRQAWLARPEVATLLTPEVRDLAGAEGHVLILGEAALVYDRDGFGAEFMRIIDSTTGDARIPRTARGPHQVTAFARDADQQVRRQQLGADGGAKLALSRLIRQVLVQAPLTIRSASWRDVMFNHRNNDDHSWLRSIDAITGSDALRLGLMAPLVAALEQSPGLSNYLRDDAALIPSLVDVLLDNPLYGSCPAIAAFNQQHLLPSLATYRSQHVLRAEDAGRPNVGQLARYLTERMPDAEWDALSGEQFAVHQISAATGILPCVAPGTSGPK